MFKFPEGLYTDVRIEEVFETKVLFTLDKLEEMKTRRYSGAFIRIFDGSRWYYCSTTDIANIQKEIDGLAAYAKPNKDINSNPVVKKFKASRGVYMKFEKYSIKDITGEEKLEFLIKYFPLMNSRPNIKLWRAQYIDKHEVKSFYSSAGADIKFDNQRAGASFSFRFADGERQFSESFKKASNYFDEVKRHAEGLEAYILKCEDFLKRAKPVEPGKYTVILSPLAAGVFAHESFGHKSEADFMLGDESMKKEWIIGKKVGAEILSIVDNGLEAGSGLVQFDDDGTRPEKTYLIKNGILSGRLHSAATAAELGEELTGNSRAMSFEFEPIVRMTTTYIEAGNKTKEELFGEVKDGVYIETIKHGSGLSTFTMAPSLAYRIRDGRIAEPLNIAVVTGNVFETLGDIDGLSDKLELLSFAEGGCGKMDQWPLPVGFGGPYMRVKNMNVQ
ncbi:MAG: Peptidase U62 modulator of DNA gyrase [uncultured bacterium]|nr:MAG: Peptidase U62 modulator of DNA gyrase [uncultured bacterium]HBC75523.1 TldD/PmbA family protein [Candidatus Wallbacteria bacterium]